jgi:hypothetical protein
MKKMIIALNVVALLIAVGYVGYIIVGVMFSGFGSPNGNGGRGFTGRELTTIVSVVLVMIISLLFSRGEGRKELVWALLPYLLFVGMFFVYLTGRSKDNKLWDETVQQDTANLASISRDYVGERGFQTFITHDREHNVLVEIRFNDRYPTGSPKGDNDPNWEPVGQYVEFASPVGKINGKSLEMFYPTYADPNNDDYKNMMLYKDQNGKSIYDNYSVVYKDGQDEKDYYLNEY